MKKLDFAMALCVVGTLAGTMALAGYKYVSTLTVDTVNRTAKGSVSDTRASADPGEYIGCRINTTNSGTSITVYCAAQDANRVTVWCSTTAPNFVQMASMIHADSILSFDWDANHTCTAMSVENWSMNAPKQL
jgi:hypothetical protein